MKHLTEEIRRTDEFKSGFFGGKVEQPIINQFKK